MALLLLLNGPIAGNLVSLAESDGGRMAANSGFPPSARDKSYL